MNQIELHKKIDELILKNPTDVKRKEVTALISVNQDASQYFYSQADERWLDWLWENGFLDVIKEKVEGPAIFRYRMPELNYLARISEKAPAKVVDIILAVPITTETFNPEITDRFLWICSILPAEQLARTIQKIRDENWIPLMGAFNQWGFEYEKMFKTLAAAEDYKSVLILAEAILAVRTKEENKLPSRDFLVDNPFFLSELLYTKVFEHLIAIDDEHTELALELATKVMAKITLLGEEGKSNEVFLVRETFSLYDIDFFSLELGGEEHISQRENVRALAATIKTLAQRLIEKRCHEQEFARKIYKKHIEILPDSRSMWRLRLYVLSLCPKAFKEELKLAFLRLFEVMEAGKPYFEIESGTEYKKSLKKSFEFFNDNYQRKYVKNIFKYFGASSEDKEKEQLYKLDGWQILSSICDHLTNDERESCEKIFDKKCDPAFEPEPSIGKVKGGIVRPRGPITQEEFGKLPVTEIAKKLRSEWAPEALRKQNMSDDFLNPLNAEGASELLRFDINKRLQDYIQNANLFFERGVLDEHYTYSFFRGIYEAIRADRSRAATIQWDVLIELLATIRKSGEEKAFNHKAWERDTLDVWLVGWTGVHSEMTGVLQELLSEQNGKIVLDFSNYRNQLFDVIDYLLAHPDPGPKDEELETAAIKTQSPDDKESLVSDPFTMAINTVRGKAFQTFVLFVYQDEKKFSKEEKIKISSDLKDLYEKVLKKENTRALMFMLGHYLPSFYFRDREWIHNLLPQIFPQEPEKMHLYLAAWEGYLTNNLYEEIFFDSAFQKSYERGLTLTGREDPKREYFRELDEGIATHLALAFIAYHKKFGFEHPLFQQFWKQDVERQAKFIKFIGRMFISGENVQADELLKKEPESIERLQKLWQWLLENYTDPKLFIEFGLWINFEKKIFEIVWLAKRVKETLEKTNGVLDWDYGLTKSILLLTKASPNDTLEIARLFLLEGRVHGGKMRMPFTVDNEWCEALKILYNHPDTRNGTYTLINELIREGGSMFWVLKEFIE